MPDAPADAIESKPHLVVTGEVESYLSLYSGTSEAGRELLAASDAGVDPLIRSFRTTEVQGAFLRWLVQLLGATKVVEVGTFTGYAALCLAEGAGEHGTVWTFDIHAPWHQFAEPFWLQAGVRNRIQARTDDVCEWARRYRVPVDLVFLDADKHQYVDYYEALVPLLRPGGLLIADDTLWGYNAAAKDEYLPDTPEFERDWQQQARSIATFNDHIQRDARVESVMLPMMNGMTLCRVV